jgi:4'-phosphopantetheinyl transferase
VLKYYHVADMKMALASHLLKRHVISMHTGIPFSEVRIGRTSDGKPVWIQPRGWTRAGCPGLSFNVSHQAGVVVGVCSVQSGGVPVDVGTDIVCVNERDELERIIREEGLYNFVDLHADVFSPSEVEGLKGEVEGLELPEVSFLDDAGRRAVARTDAVLGDGVRYVDGEGEAQVLSRDKIIAAKLRRFYALWCLREAYVKMTGEALLASWLQDLEFRRFRVPRPAEEASNGTFEDGEVVRAENIEISLRGERITDVMMELRAVGRDYVVASAVRVEGTAVREVVFGDLTTVDLGETVREGAGSKRTDCADPSIDMQNEDTIK